MNTARTKDLRANRDILIGGGRYKAFADGPMNFTLARVEPEAQDIRQSRSSFFPHALAVRNNKSSLAYAFEKIGPGAGLIDLESMEWLASIPPVKERLFYGHGVCSKDDSLLYSTETSPDGTGAIGVRDTANLNYLGDFPSYGSHPHDCHLIEHGKVLAVSNGGDTQASGKRASLCFIEVASQRLLERIDMPDERFNIGHIFPLGSHQAALVSAPRRGLGEDHLGAVSLRQGKEKLRVAQQPAEFVNQLFGESLSVVAVPKLDLFVATHPTPGWVSVWQLRTMKLKQQIRLVGARGLALSQDQRHMWISFGEQAQLVRLSLESLLLDPSSQMSSTYLTGSHLLNLPLGR